MDTPGQQVGRAALGRAGWERILLGWDFGWTGVKVVAVVTAGRIELRAAMMEGEVAVVRAGMGADCLGALARAGVPDWFLV